MRVRRVNSELVAFEVTRDDVAAVTDALEHGDYREELANAVLSSLLSRAMEAMGE